MGKHCFSEIEISLIIQYLRQYGTNSSKVNIRPLDRAESSKQNTQVWKVCVLHMENKESQMIYKANSRL